MRVICEQRKLLAAVQTAARCAASRAVMPVLGGILVSAGPSGLTVRATDTEVAVEYSIPAQVLEEGDTVISARYFSDLVRRLPDCDVTIEVDHLDRTVAFTYGTANFKLNTFSAEDFPLFPPFRRVLEDTFSQRDFKNYIRQVAAAASPEPIRPIFSGMLWEIKEGFLNMVATDTHRLALRTGIPVSQETEKALPRVIIPVKALNELCRLFGDEEEEFRIALEEGMIAFIAPEFVLAARTVEGRFPDYERAMPSSFKTVAVAEKEALISSLERASLLVSAKDRGSIVGVEVCGGRMTIFSYSAGMGSLREEMEVLQEGENIEINFNARYFLEALRVLNGKEAVLSFAGSLSPCVISDREDDNYRHLLLPVKV